MTNWKKYKLGELVTFQRGHDLVKSAFVQGKYPIAGSNGIIGFHNQYTTEGPGVTIGRSGSLGIPYYYEDNFWAHNTTLYIKEFHNSHPKFIYYLLKTMDFGGHNSGSAVPSLNRNFIHPIEVLAPDLPTQTRIASIVSSLDDKIELNRRMNQTLERIAQALFNHYFVDNIDPDNLPEGWKWGKLNEEFEITMGQSPEGSSYNQDCNGIPFFQGRTDFNFRFPSFRIYTTSPKRLAKKFDVLISVRAPVGDLNIALTDCCIGRGIGAIRNKMGYTSYTYYKIKSLAEIFKPYNGEGTVFGSINKDELGNISIIIPLKENVMAFEELVRPIDLKIYEMQKETKNLSSIRETLLPKLMCGEIDVSAVAKEEILSEL